MSDEDSDRSGEANLEDRLAELLEQATDSLESISPERALSLYLDDKGRDCQQATIDAHRSRLRFLIRWCEDNGINNLNDLTARDLHEFRVWRRQDLNTVSEKTQMDTLRVFIRWCESIGAVTPNLYRKVDSPDLEAGENARETVLHADRGREILTYLEQYEYATIDHVCWLTLAETGMRLGGARALDIRDFHPDAETSHFDVRHRPEADTPIKNKSRGERRIAVSAEACKIIEDYLQHQRPDVEDEYGREPLLATSHGRVARSTIRTYIYRWSRPCVRDTECPHDRDRTSVKRPLTATASHSARRASHPARFGGGTLRNSSVPASQSRP
jgi:integrase